MNYTVVNHGLSVGSIRVVGVASSSVLLVGDTDSVKLSSIFDTPAESLIIGPAIMPYPPEQELAPDGDGA